ncbi:hypothetical protein CEXT_486811 [Caerostris extrusa]|uniref:Uncharacterized protein n=1 Tax=Caerostris extrusa TaxID=172846 RepID=A0AAV4PAG1_CAEEX|nr:hypothetical protein CEXT_486811 [Caerostris extrusa]
MVKKEKNTTRKRKRKEMNTSPSHKKYHVFAKMQQSFRGKREKKSISAPPITIKETFKKRKSFPEKMVSLFNFVGWGEGTIPEPLTDINISMKQSELEGVMARSRG